MGATICDDRGAAGFSWVMDEPMTRTSHALVADGQVWLIDPVDDSIAMARATDLGPVGGVIQLLDRHGRDCARLAARLEVSHHLCPPQLEGSPFTFVQLTWRRWWREVALWWPDSQLLVVPEAVGTNPFFTAGRGRVGVHPLLRLTPPRRLLDFSPRQLLTGHGEGIVDTDASAELHRAVRDARRGIPAMARVAVGMRRRRG